MLTPGPALANAAVVRYAATTPPFSKNTAGVSLALSPADSCFIALHESLDPLGITVCDVSTFSATVKTGLTEFMGRACLLLDKLLNDDEHKQTFHFVLVEDLRVNACHSSQRDDSIVIGVTLGLIREIGSDEELAFVLAHELEHHHSQIEKDRREKMEARQTPRNDDLLDTIAWAFKRRSVEHECDVRAVKRLINKQISPQGGLRILSKVRARRLANNPTELPAEGHPLSMTRINAVGAILADSVRHQGQAQNYRLEQQTQTTEVLGNVHELLFKTDCLQNECFEKARAFINPDRVVDEAYQAIADNHKPETLSVEAAEHYEPASCFPEIFNYYWSRASRLLMPELPAEQRLDLQLQLVVNLDRAFKRAKQEILGDDFTVSEYWQYEMLLLLEKRTLDLDIPSIQLCLVQRAYCVEAIKKHGTIPDDTLSLETKQQNLARIERQLEIAKHVFEPGKKLEQYMAKGYTKEQLDVLLLDRRGRRFLDVELARHGLRIREVHDIIVGNKQQLEAIKRKNGFQVLLAATDIMHFIGLLNHYYSGFSRTGQQATNPSGNFIKVLHKAKALVDEALARCENGNLDKQTFEQIKTLISSISFHGDYSAPHTPEVFAHRQGFLDKAISILFSQKQLFSSTEELFNFECQIVSPSLAVLGPRGAVIKEEVQRLLVETAMTPIKQHIANGHIHEAMLALSDLTKQHKTLRTTILDSLDPVARTNINHHMLTLLKEWANAIGLTSDQLQTFVWITVPQFMPADVNSEQLAKAKADFHALCQNKNFTASLQGRCFHFWAVMHVFCNSGHAKAHLSEAYALAVMAQELWYSIDSLYYNVNFEQSLHDYLFKRLTVERPWDLKLAKILIQQVEQPTVSKSMPFLQACFRWYIDRFHGVTEATYQFWLAFDEAGISPLQDQLVLIECLINSFYTHAISPDADPSKHHLISLEFFEAYRAGVVRFAEQRQAEGGAKTTYYKTNYDEPHDQIPVKGGKALDMNLRISWQPLNDFWSEPDNYETLPIALVATAFEHWITEYGYHGINYLGHSGSQTSYHVLMFLFEHHRDHPDVRRVLLRAEMVKAAFFQSAKSRLVKWQLEQWPGFADFLPNLRAGKGRLPCKEELRPIISDIHEFLRIRFPEPCSASYEVVSFVERHLLTSKTETELLNQLRVTEQNWTSNPALYAPDAADFIAQALRTDQERMGTLRYLLGIDDDPPQLQCFSDRFAINTYSPHMVGELKKRVAHGNEFFKILCVQALLADRVNAIESQLYLECKTLIMGEATQHEALSVLFDEYMRVLPCSERKILLALAIAAYDPSTGDHVSFKRLLQAAGPLGAKMSQALVTSGAVTGSLRAELLTSFDDALPPTRKDIFDDLAKIFPDDNIVQSVGRLLGSGSLNYTVEALLRSPVEGVAQRVAVRIQKANVRGQIDNEYLVWS
ncbi:MAG TPA: M48 family metalloprotease, partial [bacterium]|nr:M48 family metalloprotease [bacterium]